MITYYQKRGTGKSCTLVLQSHAQQLPIATFSGEAARYLQWLADEVLHVQIPKPFVASEAECKKAGKYLVDEGQHVLQKLLGGEIVAMTITDEDRRAI